MPFTFQFRLIPFIAIGIAMSIGISMGQWQLRRANEKVILEQQMSSREVAPILNLNETSLKPDEAEFYRATARGSFRSDWPIYLDNRPYKGTAGFYVMMPFKLDGTDRYVLVARGWLPRDPSNRTKLAVFTTPEDVVEIKGIVRRDVGHIMQLGHAAQIQPGVIMQNLNSVDVAKASKLPMLPFMLEQTSVMQDGLVRDWPRPSSGVDKHRGYAVQWFGLAIMALIFFVVTGFRRGTR